MRGRKALFNIKIGHVVIRRIFNLFSTSFSRPYINVKNATLFQGNLNLVRMLDIFYIIVG